MKDRKIRSAETKVVAKDIRKRLELIGKELDLNLQMLDVIFTETNNCPEEFHRLYVQPLLESGLTLEDSLAMLVEGVFRPHGLILNPAAQFHTRLDSAQAKPRLEKSKLEMG